jgi:hypothetical protein
VSGRARAASRPLPFCGIQDGTPQNVGPTEGTAAATLAKNVRVAILIICLPGILSRTTQTYGTGTLLSTAYLFPVITSSGANDYSKHHSK